MSTDWVAQVKKAVSELVLQGYGVEPSGTVDTGWRDAVEQAEDLFDEIQALGKNPNQVRVAAIILSKMVDSITDGAIEGLSKYSSPTGVARLVNTLVRAGGGIPFRLMSETCVDVPTLRAGMQVAVTEVAGYQSSVASSASLDEHVEYLVAQRSKKICQRVLEILNSTAVDNAAIDAGYSPEQCAVIYILEQLQDAYVALGMGAGKPFREVEFYISAEAISEIAYEICETVGLWWDNIIYGLFIYPVVGEVAEVYDGNDIL